MKQPVQGYQLRCDGTQAGPNKAGGSSKPAQWTVLLLAHKPIQYIWIIHDSGPGQPRKEMDQVCPLRDSQSEHLISGVGGSLVLKEAGLGSA